MQAFVRFPAFHKTTQGLAVARQRRVKIRIYQVILDLGVDCALNLGSGVKID